MATKLNAFQTSLDFYDLAIVAPSMKTAWGVGRRQQSLPSGCREGNGRPGCGRRGDVQAWRGVQASCGIERALLYRMSTDWSQMYQLDGRGFVQSTE